MVMRDVIVVVRVRLRLVRMLRLGADALCPLLDLRHQAPPSALQHQDRPDSINSAYTFERSSVSSA